jgi:hypothetical protein
MKSAAGKLKNFSDPNGKVQMVLVDRILNKAVKAQHPLRIRRRSNS